MRGSRLLVGLLATFAVGCLPPPGDGNDDGCQLGSVSATSTAEDIGGCLTSAVTTATTVSLTLGDEVTMNLELLGAPPALPETWDDTNSTTFATITRGELTWQIADGAFVGGAPVGEGETTITARDGDELHGSFAGLAISTSTDALIESLFLEATF